MTPNHRSDHPSSAVNPNEPRSTNTVSQRRRSITIDHDTPRAIGTRGHHTRNP